jgi:hypothetical protein
MDLGALFSRSDGLVRQTPCLHAESVNTRRMIGKRDVFAPSKRVPEARRVDFRGSKSKDFFLGDVAH